MILAEICMLIGLVICNKQDVWGGGEMLLCGVVSYYSSFNKRFFVHHFLNTEQRINMLVFILLLYFQPGKQLLCSAHFFYSAPWGFKS